MAATIVLSGGVVIATHKATQEVETAVGEAIDEVDPHQPPGGGVGPAAAADADAVAVAGAGADKGSAYGYGEEWLGVFDDRGMDWITDYYYGAAAAAEKEFEKEMEKEGSLPLVWYYDDGKEAVLPMPTPPLRPKEEESGGEGTGKEKGKEKGSKRPKGKAKGT